MSIWALALASPFFMLEPTSQVMVEVDAGNYVERDVGSAYMQC